MATTDQTRPSDSSTTAPRGAGTRDPGSKPPLRRRLRWLLLGPAVLLAGGWCARRAHAFGHGPWGHGDFTPEEMETFIGKRVERGLDRLDATPEQKTRVKELMARLRPEVRSLHDAKKKLREASLRAFSAERVDAQEIERIRREALGLAEKGSHLAARAAGELGQILTAEQRRRMLEHFGRHRRGF